MAVKSEENIGGKWFQFGAAFIANLIGITDGIAMGWTSPMLPYFLSENTHIVMTRREAEWFETSILLGAVCGLPFTAYCVEEFGRKKSLILSCSVLIVSWITVAVGNHLAYIIASRFVQGLGLNMAFVAAPMYVGEISHKRIRGFLSSLIFVMSMLGITIVYVVGTFLPFYVPSVISVSILVIEIFSLSFLPESPYFYVMKVRYEEAAASLRKFRESSEVETELEDIKKVINQSKQREDLFEIFKVRNYYRAILIMFILNIGQILCSFEVFLMNLYEILESAGCAYLESSYVTILFSTLNFLSSILASFLVDKFGRKGLLLVSVSLTAICLFLLALYFNLQHLEFNTKSFSWIPVVTVMIYAVVYRLGLGMVPIVLTAEIFAPKIKAFGMTFSDGVFLGSSVLILQVFFILRDRFGLFAPFYVFFCCSMLLIICIVYIVPETKGKTLEEIQDILRN